MKNHSVQGSLSGSFDSHLIIPYLKANVKIYTTRKWLLLGIFSWPKNFAAYSDHI